MRLVLFPKEAQGSLCTSSIIWGHGEKVLFMKNEPLPATESGLDAGLSQPQDWEKSASVA